MSFSTISYVNINTDTFDQWITATNNVITALTTNVVTIGLGGTVGLTTGNGFVQGIFGANSIVATTITAGNVTNSGSLLTIASNTALTGNSVAVSGTLLVNSTTALFSANTLVQTSSPTVIDTFSTSSYRTAKYVISVTDNAANNFQSTELMLMHSGGSAYTTEYATLISNSTIAQFSASISSGNVNLTYTPATSNSTVKLNRITVGV